MNKELIILQFCIGCVGLQSCTGKNINEKNLTNSDLCKEVDGKGELKRNEESVDLQNCTGRNVNEKNLANNDSYRK